MRTEPDQHITECLLIIVCVLCSSHPLVALLQEHDLEAVYEEPPPKLAAARTAVCAAAVVVLAIACLFVVALVFHHGMNIDGGAEKVGAGLFLV